MIGSTSSTSLKNSGSLIEIEKRALSGIAKLVKKDSSNTQSENRITAAVSKNNPTGKASTSTSSSPEELTTSDKTEIRKLKSRDTEVRAHERAHMAAGGNLVRGGASYSYTTGPDNKRYAIGGEVSIDTSPVEDDPQATKIKGEHIRRAALAPAKPSSQDYAVASSATQMIMQAQIELSRQNLQTNDSQSDSSGSSILSAPAVKAINAYSGVFDLPSSGLYKDIIV